MFLKLVPKNGKSLIVTLILFACIYVILLSGCSKFFKTEDDKTQAIDLNNDGKKELIRIKRLKVEVLSPDKKKLGDFKIFDYSDQIKFVDLNKNGQKQIALWTQGQEGFRISFKVYKLRGNRLDEVFNIDTNDKINTNFGAVVPTLEIGSFIWFWDGEQFVQR